MRHMCVYVHERVCVARRSMTVSMTTIIMLVFRKRTAYSMCLFRRNVCKCLYCKGVCLCVASVLGNQKKRVVAQSLLDLIWPFLFLSFLRWNQNEMRSFLKLFRTIREARALSLHLLSLFSLGEIIEILKRFVFLRVFSNLFLFSNIWLCTSHAYFFSRERVCVHLSRASECLWSRQCVCVCVCVCECSAFARGDSVM